MSELKNIAFEDESNEIKDRVVDYWSKRAETFSEHKHAEIHSEKVSLWREEILKYLPKNRILDILDVGCGAGFFEAVLAPLGHNVTGIDLTPEMIEHGKDLLKRHKINADLFVMDAENPTFTDESFDVVISRNLVWTLPHPIEAYQRWMKLLKPGGKLIVFDAEYAKGFHKYNWADNTAHKVVDDELKEECHRLYHMLSISTLNRPDWDAEVLGHIGFSDIKKDLFVGDRIYSAQDEFYMPDRMFSICATKL